MTLLPAARKKKKSVLGGSCDGLAALASSSGAPGDLSVSMLEQNASRGEEATEACGRA